MITGSKDREIRIFDLTTFELKHLLQPTHYDSISSLAVSNNLLFSAGGSQFGFLKQWNLQTLGGQITSNGAHKESVLSMVSVRGGTAGLLLSASKDGVIKGWNPESCECLGELKAHDVSINQMVLRRGDSSSSLLLTASNDKTVRAWRLKTQ